MDTIVGLVTLGVVFLAAYFYGVRVGLTAGTKAGRAQADAEWARMMENGMVAGPEPFMGDVFASGDPGRP